MNARALLGLALAGGYFLFLAHATVGAQCPVREMGPCAKVHQMLARRPGVVPPVLVIAAPMKGAVGDPPIRLAAADSGSR